MKNLLYKTLIFLSLILVAQQVSASMYIEKRRTLRKAFAVNESTSIDISSKYGTINLTHWDKDSIAFKIEIIGKSKSEDFSQEMIDDTQVKFSANDA
ncbi:MAG: hypothetical protein ACPGLV_12605, partial [Bacteroidia bacterium]